MKKFASKEKKYLLIFPPVWVFTNPHIAVPLLVSQLKNNGFDAKGMDLNIDFFHHILTKEKLMKALEQAKEQYEYLSSIKDSFYDKKDTIENKALNYKYNELKVVFEQKYEFYHRIIQKVDKVVEILKKPQLFYDYKNLVKSIFIIKNLLRVFSLPYLPARILAEGKYVNEFLNLNYVDIKRTVFDEAQNMFLDFYKSVLEEIKEKEYSYIGISISSYEQLIAGLTLSKLLKEQTNAHINIGGRFFSGTIEGLKNNPEFFDIFADSVSYNEGENAIIELAKYINEEITIEEVSNLIYKKGNEVKVNAQAEPVLLSKIGISDYTDYNLEKYYSPEKILPLHINNGCYWNKCAFCNHSGCKTYSIKKIDSVIKEIKEYKEKYGVVYFDIIDEALPPKFLEEFSEALIANNLNIKFRTCMRLEEKIDYKLLKKAYKAGLRYIQWGFETGNKRIHDLMNKGVNFEKRLGVIKAANKAGIVNFLFSFLNFPTETYEEAKETVDFFIKNHKYVQLYGMCDFALYSQAEEIIQNPSKYAIEILDEYEEFSDRRKYISHSGMNSEEFEKIKEECKKMACKYYAEKIFMYFNFSESVYTLLYNSKYSLKFLKRIKIDRKIFNKNIKNKTSIVSKIKKIFLK